MSNDPLEKFKQIFTENPDIAKHRGRITEADTRANVLDRIIHEVLEWPRDCVDREPFGNPGFIDYQLVHGRPILLVEAKTEGISFGLPYQKQPRNSLKINGMLSSDTEIAEAIIQVQRYCSDTGSSFAAITNGYTFIIFQALSVGSPWKEKQAVIYHDYNHIVKNFTNFWNLLSYEAIKDGKLDETFRKEFISSRSYYRPIDQIVDSDATYGRNPLNEALKPYINRFFGDIASQDTVDILKNCYVYSKPLQRIDSDLKLTIKDEIPKFALAAKQIFVNGDSDGGNVGGEIKKLAIDRPHNGSVVLIMGGIGSGKSTFCKRFFKVISPEIIKKDGPGMLVYLEFLGAPDSPDLINQFLWENTSKTIKKIEPNFIKKELLKKLFSEEIKIHQELFEGEKDLEVRIGNTIFDLYKQPQKFVEAALAYSAKSERLPIVVFDNVDQLKFETQAQIFSAAHNFSTNFGCMSLVVLREESYSTALMKKHLTAYNIRPYHLSSPRFNKLLELRINYAVNEAAMNSKTDDAKKEEELYAEIAELLGLFRESILGKNKNIIRLVEAIAYGNMRLALDLFNSFISSGATNIPKILKAYKNSGSYVVPFHEFIKSVMLGDYMFYKEQRSLIFNIFNASSKPNASHFTALRILNYLYHMSSGQDRSDSFVGLQSLINTVSDMFDNEADCIETILRLIAVDRQLVELDSRRPDSLTGASSIRITASGAYYLNFMVNSFQYCDLVWHDTPFSKRGLCDQMKRRINAVDLVVRFKRVELFIEYLQKEENMELDRAGALNDKSTIFGPFVPKLKEYYIKEKKLICGKNGITYEAPL